MYNDCERIPNIIEFSDYGGDYTAYENAVYCIFQHSIDKKKLYFNGKPVVHKKHPVVKGKSGTFWHIVSSGDIESERLPDIRRYERIMWPSFILEYCVDECEDVRIWENERKGKKRVVIWCYEVEYVVILDKREDYYIFWTSYPITQNHTRRKLFKEYNAYKAKSAY